MNKLDDSDSYIFDMEDEPFGYTPFEKDEVEHFNDTFGIFTTPNNKSYSLEKFVDEQSSYFLNDEIFATCPELFYNQNSLTHDSSKDISIFDASAAKVSINELNKKYFPTNSICTNQTENKTYKHSKRKLQSDGIRKKIMSNFLNRSTRNKLNEILYHHYQSNLKKLKKLKLAIVTKVDSATIKQLLEKTILELYLQDGSDHNLRIIFNTINENPQFRDFLNMTFEQAFVKYIGSAAYMNDLENLKLKETEEYIKEYDDHARNFITYYKYVNPYQRRNSSKRVSE
jgi:hypothetical protein